MFGFGLDLALMVGVGYVISAIKVVKEYDRLVVFTLGKANNVSGPGLQLVFPLLQNARKVDLRVMTMSIPMQEVITKDNISCKTAAVCFFQVIDPYKVTTKIENPQMAIEQIAQTTLRSILGQHELDEILTERDAINAKLSAIIDRQTEGWGIKVNAVEIKDVEIPESMQRAMARQAEAERERRAKIVAAEGEHQAAERLALAAQVISNQPGAMQLRQLQTMVEISSEKNSTLILPIPIELLEFAKRQTPGVVQGVVQGVVPGAMQGVAPGLAQGVLDGDATIHIPEEVPVKAHAKKQNSEAAGEQ
ncbi:MAG TPA: slipin family protein [Chroococcales cyanobacterium]